MPTEVLPVDVAGMLITELRTDADLNALLDFRVYPAIPRMPKWPLLTVQEINPTSSFPHWLENMLVQVDAWADTREAASLAVRTAHLALRRLEGRQTDYGTITAVDPFSRQWQPDTRAKPPRPRFVLQARVYVHPLPSS